MVTPPFGPSLVRREVTREGRGFYARAVITRLVSKNGKKVLKLLFFDDDFVKEMTLDK